MTRIDFRSTLAFALLSGLGIPVAAQQSDSLAARPFWAVYVGAGVTGDFQFIAGGQAWLRSPLRPLSIVPELAIGHGTSFLAGVGAHLTTAPAKTRFYGGLQAAYFWFSSGDVEIGDLVFTPKAGLLFNTGALDGLFGSKVAGWMVEYQGVDWFDQSRILIGVRWTF